MNLGVGQDKIFYMSSIIDALTDNPFDPERKEIHAGKVFVFPHGVLKAVRAKSSDGRRFDNAKDHFFLCLWDLDDGPSLWIALQSEGEFEVPFESKRMHEGVDLNWMDQHKKSHYRDAAIYRLGTLGTPISFSQKQKRYVTRLEMEKIRKTISNESIYKLLE